MSKLGLWSIGDEEFVIAADVADARAVMAEQGATTDDIEDEDITRRPDEKPFTFVDGCTETTKTCAEWVAERGRGYFCTANY